MPDTSISLPTEVVVKRSDPVYNAHSYLTKVPLPAIEPFIEAFTKPGDLVLDVFAGSGMTGVAAAVLGRRAILIDISELGRHIGQNYLNLVDTSLLRTAAAQVVAETKKRLGDIYGVSCAACGARGELSKRTWSAVVACRDCGTSINYYAALETAQWNKQAMCCSNCGSKVKLRLMPRVGEEPVLDTIICDCSAVMRDQPPTPPVHGVSLAGLSWPDIPIDADRQMYQASGLGKHKLRTIADFFSERNLAALAALHEQIVAVHDSEVRNKLLFAFTAILARASKRYQWSRKRPLNAANQNYYIAPVFYEWNVYDLFERKIEAVIRSDSHIRQRSGGPIFTSCFDVTYRIGSADAIDLADGSVDYVFTDPPFGSNIFYSDMNLFQEAWLGTLTDHTQEAVVDRSGNGATKRTAARYERLLTDALRECHRVLKPEGWLSLVFSNSSGEMWALLQRAIREAGFVLDPDRITLLDKGQRSVKGLASGFEDVVTIDVVLSMRKRTEDDPSAVAPRPREISQVLSNVLAADHFTSPSQVYLSVVRECLRHHWDLTDVEYRVVARELEERGYRVDNNSGRFVDST